MFYVFFRLNNISLTEMTKRIGDSSNNNNKKFKTNKELDDLWGDDLDDKDVDDCFLLATQICEQPTHSCSHRNNVSILPSYNGFALKKTSTSTQLDVNVPTTSKLTSYQNGFKRTRSFDTPESSQNLEFRVRNLQEQCLAKEGEVSILRSQIKELRTNKEKEYCKKQMEWNSKLLALTEKLNSVESQLEFKNLEIANLKQQVGSMKANGLSQSFNCSQSPYFKAPKIVEKTLIKKTNENAKSVQNNKEKTGENFKIRATTTEEYPLQKIFPHTLFDVYCGEENYSVDRKIDASRNGLLQNERVVWLQPKQTILSNGQQLDFNYVKSVLVKLKSCTLSEIDATETISDINKLICTSEQLLNNFYTFLVELEQNTVSCDDFDKKLAEEDDLDASLFDPNPLCKNEIGINLRQCLACVAEVLPYNSYLRGYLLENKPLVFKQNYEFQHLPVYRAEPPFNFNYLQYVVEIVTLLNRLQKSYFCPGLLSAICILLSKISVASVDKTNKSIILDLSREIVFSKPKPRVTVHFLEFLLGASLQSRFINELCKIGRNKRGEEKEMCLLHVFCTHLESSLLKMKGFESAYLTFIEFTLNVVRLDPKWFYYQEDKDCDCLCKLVNVIVDMIYQVIKPFHQNLNDKIKRQDYALSKQILIKGITILYILNYKVYDLLIKYAATFSQYKVITNLLCDLKDELSLDESHYDALELLNFGTEAPLMKVETNTVSFEGITTW